MYFTCPTDRVVSSFWSFICLSLQMLSSQQVSRLLMEAHVRCRDILLCEIFTYSCCSISDTYTRSIVSDSHTHISLPSTHIRACTLPLSRTHTYTYTHRSTVWFYSSFTRSSDDGALPIIVGCLTRLDLVTVALLCGVDTAPTAAERQ